MHHFLTKRWILFSGVCCAFIGTILYLLYTLLLYLSLHISTYNIQLFVEQSNYHTKQQLILNQMDHPLQQLLTYYQYHLLIVTSLALMLLILGLCLFRLFMPLLPVLTLFKRGCQALAGLFLTLIVGGLFFQPQLQTFLTMKQQEHLVSLASPTPFTFMQTSDMTNGLTVKFPATDFALFQTSSVTLHQWTFLLLGVLVFTYLIVILLLGLGSWLISRVLTSAFDPKHAPKLQLTPYSKHKNTHV